MINKNLNIWQALVLAPLGIPIVTIVIFVPITIIGALDDTITKLQIAGYWWLLTIPLYSLSFAYLYYIPKIQIKMERNKVVNGLILYWKEQISKQNKPAPSNTEIEAVRDMLLERFNVWTRSDLRLWSRYYPNEKYSKYLFGIVDNFITFVNK